MPVFYLPPVRWWKDYFQSENPILEIWENLPKQTFRNRCQIYGANGILNLMIPVRHEGRRLYRDIRISYAERWQELHWKSIKNVYQASPYFEYYEENFLSLYTHQEEFLLEFNLKTLDLILNLLKEESRHSFSTSYQKDGNFKDVRSSYSAKGICPTDLELKTYYQIFSDKGGFKPNLSILDVLCHLGPKTISYLSND